MKKFFLVGFLCIMIYLVNSDELQAFKITDKGNPAANVVIKENATDAEKYAANEFVKYIEKISHAKLDISQTPKEKNIFIQATGDKDNEDSVSIRAENNNLYIEGASPRSTIYAVYELLVKFLGCEFYTKDIEQIPNIQSISLKDNLNYSYKPPFFSREAFYAGNEKYPEFAVKSKLNGHYNYIDQEMGGHISLINWCHSTLGLVSPEKYFDEHPEYFAMQKGRRVSGYGGQLCWTNKEMQKVLAKEVLSVLDSAQNPKIIDVSQMDNIVYCECEDCQKALEKYTSPSGALLEMINEVAREVKEKYPNVYIETLAYNHTLKAPKNIKPEDNVIIRVCDIENNFAEPIIKRSENAPYEYVNGRPFDYTDYNTINRDFADNLEAWGKICKRLYVWDYTVNFSNSHIIHPNIQVLQPNIRYFRDHNVVALYEQGDYYNENATFNDLKNFLISKLLWNPDENVQKLKENFCKNVYGKGYKEILKIVDIYSKAITETPYFLPTYVYDMEWMSESDYIKSVKLFQSALKKTDLSMWKKDSIAPVVEENLTWKDYSPYRKIYTAYLDFLYGWYLMEVEKQTRISKACNLPWADLNEYEEYFISYCEKVANGFVSEGGKFNTKAEVRKLEKSQKIPKICENLKDEDWFELGSKFMGLRAIGMEAEDKDASDGYVTWLYPTQGEWSVQCNIQGNILEYMKQGKTSVDLYVECKSVKKNNNTGDIATLGVWDYNLNKNLFQKNIPVKDLNDDNFSIIYLGTWELKNLKDPTVYLCGVNNPLCAEAIAIDRVIGVIK